MQSAHDSCFDRMLFKSAMSTLTSDARREETKREDEAKESSKAHYRIFTGMRRGGTLNAKHMVDTCLVPILTSSEVLHCTFSCFDSKPGVQYSCRNNVPQDRS